MPTFIVNLRSCYYVALESTLLLGIGGRNYGVRVLAEGTRTVRSYLTLPYLTLITV